MPRKFYQSVNRLVPLDMVILDKNVQLHPAAIECAEAIREEIATKGLRSPIRVKPTDEDFLCADYEDDTVRLLGVRIMTSMRVRVQNHGRYEPADRVFAMIPAEIVA